MSAVALQTNTSPAKNENNLAEVILRNGTAVKAVPSMSSDSYLNEPNVDRSEVTLICFPDCKGAPRDSSEKDLIVLKDGRRKSGEITWINPDSNNRQGPFVKLSIPEGTDEYIPFSEIKYIRFSDHVFYSLRQALRAPASTRRLVLRSDAACRTTDAEHEPGFQTDSSGDIHLKHLSPKLGKLTSLKELDLACLEELADLPHEIGNLKGLEKLIMNNGNGCKMGVALPASIGQLAGLRVLDLYGALGKRFPVAIASLHNLEELDLGHNDISTVPPQIASLHKLRRLGLDYDPLRQIPTFVGNLKSLRELSLISIASGPQRPIELPQSLAFLRGLKIFLGNNYLKLRDQQRLRRRSPNAVFSFGNEFDDESANEEAPESKPSR